MIKYKLTPEQSEHLIELGFPKWRVQEIKPLDINLKDWIPTITIIDLLEILPKEKVEMRVSLLNNKWYISYYPTSSEYNIGERKEEFIDSLYDLCCWLLENNLLPIEKLPYKSST